MFFRCIDIEVAPDLWYNKITISNKYKRRGANLMIYQMDQNENTQNQFSETVKELQIGKFLRKSNISKSCGVSAYEVFQLLLLLVFQGKNFSVS